MLLLVAEPEPEPRLEPEPEPEPRPEPEAEPKPESEPSHSQHASEAPGSVEQCTWLGAPTAYVAHVPRPML